MVAMPNIDDFNASWSNRNGGEVLVTIGSLRLTLSAAIAATVHAKFGAALSVPERAAEMARREPLPEPERIADPAVSINESIDQRRRTLGAIFPFRAKRLQAVVGAIEEAGPMADIVAVASVLFTMDEARAVAAALRVESDGPY